MAYNIYLQICQRIGISQYTPLTSRLGKLDAFEFLHSLVNRDKGGGFTHIY